MYKINKFISKTIKVLLLVMLLTLIIAVPVLAAPATAEGGDTPLAVVVNEGWLVATFGVVLSLVCSYVPGVNTWFAAKSKEFKQLFMALGILIIVCVVFSLTCYNLITSNLTCSLNGAANALMVYVFTLAANQGVYSVSPQTSIVKAVKNTV